MKAVVLFSGGLDSTTCLAEAIEKYGATNVVALSISYGQKHKKEIDCSDKLAEYYGVKHMKLDASEIFKNSGCSLLEHSGQEVPDGTYKEQKEEGEITTYVPFRNGLFLSIASAVAISEECEVIYYGAHKDDYVGGAYPDCTPDFQEAISKAIYLGSGEKVKVEAPFINEDKAGIVKEGLRLKVPYKLTWSCYKGGEKPCRKCATCLDRERAFEINGKVDPLYE